MYTIPKEKINLKGKIQMKRRMNSNFGVRMITIILVLLCVLINPITALASYTVYPPTVNDITLPVLCDRDGVYSSYNLTFTARVRDLRVVLCPLAPIAIGTNLAIQTGGEAVNETKGGHLCGPCQQPNGSRQSHILDLVGSSPNMYYYIINTNRATTVYWSHETHARCMGPANGQVPHLFPRPEDAEDQWVVTWGTLDSSTRVSTVNEGPVGTVTHADGWVYQEIPVQLEPGSNFVGVKPVYQYWTGTTHGAEVRYPSVIRGSDLSIKKELQHTDIDLDQEDTTKVTLTITNEGGKTAGGITLTDTLDTGFDLVPNSIMVNGTPHSDYAYNSSSKVLSIPLSSSVEWLGGTEQTDIVKTATVTFDLKVNRGGTWQNQVRCDFYDRGYETRPESNYYQYSNVVSLDAYGGTEYTYKVTADEGGSATPTAEGSVTSGTEISITATPNAGYEFDKWVVVDDKEPASYESAETVANNKFTMPANDVHIKATFKKIDYTVNAYGELGKGAGTADKGTANVGDVVTLTATPEPGFMFVGWVVKNGTITDTEFDPTDPDASFKMPAGNVEVQATFAPIVTSITIKKEVVGTKGDANDVFNISLSESNTLLTSVVLKEGESSSALSLGMGGASSKTINVSELIPMDYDDDFTLSVIDNKDSSETETPITGKAVTVNLGDDITIVVKNTFTPTGFFKAKDFVKNIFK